MRPSKVTAPTAADVELAKKFIVWLSSTWATTFTYSDIEGNIIYERIKANIPNPPSVGDWRKGMKARMTGEKGAIKLALKELSKEEILREFSDLHGTRYVLTEKAKDPEVVAGILQQGNAAITNSGRVV